jgi:ATP-binding cassette, subfamily C (CFTR/MRP), member 1
MAAYGAPYVFAAFLKVVQDVLSFLQPQLLRWLLLYISDYQRARALELQPPSAFKGFAIAGTMVNSMPIRRYKIRC